MSDDNKYECGECGKQLSRSGYYKHIKKCGVVEKQEKEEEETYGGESDDISSFISQSDELGVPPPNTPASSSWMDYTPVVEENVTEKMPTPLKFVEKLATAKPKKKYTAKELKEIEKANIALLKMGLGATDVLITRYGQAVMEDKEYECKHSDNDKTMVAKSQNAWLEENGVNLSQHIGKGKIALLMSGYYVAPPLLKIQKKRTKRLIKKGLFRNLLNKLKFRRRKKAVKPNVELSE